MFTKILIANRGEIACRVIKTANRMGIRTVAVYSDADKNSLHVKLADEAIHIGAAPSSESYLVADRIIQAALKTGAQAIHPGYGFLSENAGFARGCAEHGLVFIGPPATSIESMGSKSAAKTIMERAGVPLVPGYHGDDQNPALIKNAADTMGYPVLLKAVAGGGGKGMRQIWSADEFDQGLAEAKRESMASFGNDDMLVEKYLTQPRHIEFQVFCDGQGNGVYLFERDCSVQRRHQKVIEEAPAPNMSETLRSEMGLAAVKAAQAIDYQGAGTVEFLLDVDGSFYFMEMNTRLQVEHPVTEMITGEDLVEWQFRVAFGQPLPKQQNELTINGHSFETRVYAEDPNNDFLPTTGQLKTLRTPTLTEYVRIDTGVEEGDEVSPFYDPMIAKLITWDNTREAALARTAKALREYQIDGVVTNLEFLYDLATSNAFRSADLDTGFIEKHHDELFRKQHIDQARVLSQAALFLTLRQAELTSEQHANNSAYDLSFASDPWRSNDGWRLNQRNELRYNIKLMSHTSDSTKTLDHHALTLIVKDNDYVIHVDGENGPIKITAQAELMDQELTTILDGHRSRVTVSENTETFTVFGEHGSQRFAIVAPDLGDEQTDQAQTGFAAPMNGTVIDVLVKTHDKVKEGQALIIMEAMKMQHTMTAPSDGHVSELYCETGDLVDGGTSLLEFEPSVVQR
ncbi:acetyl/propionyl/methylcrotonyl-CoA carboxylase subunit alpha [Arenicella sp. 4NH20-0111]|uniref:acetyl/propionyl/methylcrotonyl-CoA carboxylase subunit alpha n=1 Tax=Arenicella sp. 4NH20-0111 TaxID=3127648 RepID=UPI00310B46F3